ncbi:MAG: MFS transporter, partial [Chloroflexota bacterium]
RYDKRGALAAGLVLAALGALSLLLVPEGGLAQLLFSSAVFGVGLGAVQVLPFSMMAEVADAVALETGERCEGLHYGISDFLRKLGVNLAVALTTATLSWLGYVAQGPQPAAVVEGIRYLIALAPAALCLAAALVALRFPISRAEHARIRQQLEARRLTG